MPDNHDEIKTSEPVVLFVTEQGPRPWENDPANPKALEQFIDDCIHNGFPVWQAGPFFYVLAGGRWA